MSEFIRATAFLSGNWFTSSGWNFLNVATEQPLESGYVYVPFGTETAIWQCGPIPSFTVDSAVLRVSMSAAATKGLKIEIETNNGTFLITNLLESTGTAYEVQEIQLTDAQSIFADPVTDIKIRFTNVGTPVYVRWFEIEVFSGGSAFIPKIIMM